MPGSNPKVDIYLQDGCMRCELGSTPACKVNDWVGELKELRRILQETELVEEHKWGVPCYTHDGKNILLLSALKGSANLSFFKGALMKDPGGILSKPGKNSQAARFIKYTDLEKIREQESTIKA